MYYAEVLSKLPVAQHFLFGSLLPYPRPSTSLDSETGPGRVEEGISRDSHGHLHVRGEGFGDCCGIAIPSGFAAAREARLKARESEGALGGSHLTRRGALQTSFVGSFLNRLEISVARSKGT
jgi:hypothetical protein